MIAYATIVLALASFVVGAQPCRGQEFSLEMSIQDQSGLVGSYLPLKLLSSDPPGVFFIVGETQSGCPSTPVYLNDTTATRTTPDDGTEGGTVISPTGALAFDLIDQSIEPTSAERGVYGIQMPYVGDEGLGGWIVVQALRGYQDFGFIVNAVTGAVYYNITGPANQHFFACNDYFGGVPYVVLSWGKYKENGDAPYECHPTTVSQKFDIERGATFQEQLDGNLGNKCG